MLYNPETLIVLFGLVLEKFGHYRNWLQVQRPHARGQNADYNAFCATFGEMVGSNEEGVKMAINYALPPSTTPNEFDNAPHNRRLRTPATAAALIAGFIDSEHIPAPLPGSAFVPAWDGTKRNEPA